VSVSVPVSVFVSVRVEEIQLISTNTEVGTVLRRKRDASDEAMNFTDLDT
jgi:hypothetical protein